MDSVWLTLSRTIWQVSSVWFLVKMLCKLEFSLQQCAMLNLPTYFHLIGCCNKKKKRWVWMIAYLTTLKSVRVTRYLIAWKSAPSLSPYHSCPAAFWSLSALEQLQGPHHQWHIRCLSGVWSGTTLRRTSVQLSKTSDNSQCKTYGSEGGRGLGKGKGKGNLTHWSFSNLESSEMLHLLRGLPVW